MTTNCNHDKLRLDWLAFQYAAGELRGAELNEFESLLSHDDQACEALAQAVLLGQAVAQCESTSSPVVVPARTTSRRALWQPVSVACGVACVALGLVWWKPTGADNQQANLKHPSPLVSSEVAALWIHNADEDLAADQSGSSHVDLDAGADEVSDADDAIPNWMLAALNQEQQDGEEQLMND